MSFKKATQLLSLARLVASRRLGVTLVEIQSEFCCCERTAQRMLRALDDVFPELEPDAEPDSDGRKRWQLEFQHIREFFSFTPRNSRHSKARPASSTPNP